jgi:hypothetical protein
MDRMRLCVGIVLLIFGVITCGCIESVPSRAVNLPSLVLTLTNTVSPTPTLIAGHSPSPMLTASFIPTSPSPAPGALPDYETRTAAPAPTHTDTPIPSPTASATLMPPSPMPTETVTPSPVAATPVPGPGEADETGQTPYRYHPLSPAQPDSSQPCPGCPRAPGYIAGRVVDAGGNPLPGVRLVCYNDWHRYPVVGSKGGGEYDFPILQAEATWYVVILDESDQPISPEVPVHFNPLEACWYRLDWQRID